MSERVFELSEADRLHVRAHTLRLDAAMVQVLTDPDLWKLVQLVMLALSARHGWGWQITPDPAGWDLVAYRDTLRPRRRSSSPLNTALSHLTRLIRERVPDLAHASGPHLRRNMLSLCRLWFGHHPDPDQLVLQLYRLLPDNPATLHGGPHITLPLDLSDEHLAQVLAYRRYALIEQGLTAKRDIDGQFALTFFVRDAPYPAPTPLVRTGIPIPDTTGALKRGPSGRPSLANDYVPPHFSERYRAAYATAKARSDQRGRRRPSQEEIADEYGHDRQTLGKYLSNARMAWHPRNPDEESINWIFSLERAP